MLGHKVFQTLSHTYDVYATFRDVDGPWRRYPVYAAVEADHLLGGIDAMNFDSIVSAFARVRPDVVINCIGIIKQLKAAHDPIVSLNLNALFPHRVAELCAAARVRLVHVSTDCVFSGRKGNYTEDDIPDPEDLYGRTKLLGEINREGCLTLRTSIIGRDFQKNSGLLEWFLSQQGKSIQGYKNAIYTGVTTQALAQIIGNVINTHPQLWGLYQVASEPISKYELLCKIRDAMQLDIDIAPYDNALCDRSMSAARFIATTNYRIPSWNVMIAMLVEDPTPYDEWREHHATPATR